MTNGHKFQTPPPVEDVLTTLNEPLPWSDEAERGLLACIIHRPEHLDSGDVSSHLFYAKAHRDLFGILRGMRSKYLPIDLGPIVAHARSMGTLEALGGAAGVAEVYGLSPLSSHFAFYLKTLRELATLRLTIGALANSLATVQRFAKGSENDTLAGICAKVESTLADISADDVADEIPHRPIAEILDAVIDDSSKRAENPGAIPGVSTGIKWLDEQTGGMDVGRMWSVGAASSDGKSSLCRQMCESAASAGHAVDIYTYEMMDTEEGGRLICSEGTVPRDAIKFGKYTREQQGNFQTAVQKIKDWDIRIIDVAGIRVERICASIRKRRRKLRPGQRLIVLVDYIQLALTESKEPSRQRSLAFISSLLKQTAKQTGCTILVPSQINKDGDAREAMDIEQDSDVFLKIKRVEEKKASTRGAYQKDKEKEATDESNVREIYIHKNRDGPKGTSIKMRLLGQFFRFEPVY